MGDNAVLRRLSEEMERETAAMDDIMAGIEDRDPTESEMQLHARKQARVVELEAMISPLLKEEERRAASVDVSKVLRSHPPVPAGPGAIVPSNPGTGDSPYRTFAQFAWDTLIVRFDQLGSRFGPEVRARAAERLNATVASTLLADIPGLLPAQHLTQIFDVINTRRPVVESAGRKITLTSKTPTYPHITQRPTVGVQATEKTEGTSQKMTVAMAQLATATYFGVGDLSWQDIQFSSPEALGLWFDLAAEAYAAATEAAACTAITGGATTGPALPATPTTADFLTAIAAAAATVAAGVKSFANTIYASPNVGFFLGGAFGAGTRTFGANGNIDLATGQGDVGGMRLVTSMGFAAGTLVVADSGFLVVGETPAAPERLQAVEVSIGGIETGIIGQFGAALADAKAFVKVTGAPVLEMAAESEPAPAEPSGGSGKRGVR